MGASLACIGDCNKVPGLTEAAVKPEPFQSAPYRARESWDSTRPVGHVSFVGDVGGEITFH